MEWDDDRVCMHETKSLVCDYIGVEGTADDRHLM